MMDKESECQMVIMELDRAETALINAVESMRALQNKYGAYLSYGGVNSLSYVKTYIEHIIYYRGSAASLDLQKAKQVIKNIISEDTSGHRN